MSDGHVKLQTNKLLLCEGKEEKAIAMQMVDEVLVQTVDVLALGDADPAGGIGALKRNLEGLPALTGFHNVTAIGLFLDNDSDPAAAFARVQTVLDDINGDASSDLYGRVSVPALPYGTATTGPINITTFFSPGPGRNGCLETLLLEVFDDLYGAKTACVNDLIKCAGILGESPTWADQKVDKAKVRASLAIIYRRNPAVTLAMLWKNDPALLPVNHALLQPVRDFIDNI